MPTIVTLKTSVLARDGHVPHRLDADAPSAGSVFCFDKEVMSGSKLTKENLA